MLELIKDLGMQFVTEASRLPKRTGLYKCICGKEFKTRIDCVKNGNTKSCGCLKIKSVKEFRTKHGLSRHRIYNNWKSMVRRCTIAEDLNYENYGGRGITVCERWLKVENFIEDMYPTFIEGLSIDRIDNNKGYSKENCRWVNMTTQSRNRRAGGNNKTGYRGVYEVRRKSTTRYQAQICVNKKNIRLGLYDNAIEAALAYDKYVTDNLLEHNINFGTELAINTNNVLMLQ